MIILIVWLSVAAIVSCLMVFVDAYQCAKEGISYDWSDLVPSALIGFVWPVILATVLAVSPFALVAAIAGTIGRRRAVPK